MFFFGIFSSLLPYVIIAGIYAVFMITLSIEKHSKDGLTEPEVKNIVIENRQPQSVEKAIHFNDVVQSMNANFYEPEPEALPAQTELVTHPPGRLGFKATTASKTYSLYPIPPPVLS